MKKKKCLSLFSIEVSHCQKNILNVCIVVPMWNIAYLIPYQVDIMHIIFFLQERNVSLFVVLTEIGMQWHITDCRGRKEPQQGVIRPTRTQTTPTQFVFLSFWLLPDKRRGKLCLNARLAQHSDREGQRPSVFTVRLTARCLVSRPTNQSLGLQGL